MLVSWLAACFIQSIVCFSNTVSHQFYCPHFLILLFKNNLCANFLSVRWRLFFVLAVLELSLQFKFVHFILTCTVNQQFTGNGNP